MLDRFDGLRHDAVVRRRDQHDHVRHLSATARIAVNAA